MTTKRTAKRTTMGRPPKPGGRQGRALHRARVAKGYTQVDAAALLRVTPKTYRSWERGDVLLRAWTLRGVLSTLEG